METAAKYDKPPSHWLGNRGAWTAKDYPLTLAYTVYRDRLCECGHDKLLCRHPDNDGWFEAHTSVCQAKAAVERLTGAKGYEPEPGELVYTTYERPDSKPLPPFPAS